jgi:putative pyruvate formate lyase activating enzyme
MTLDEVCNAIVELLPLSENNLGFVSPTHFFSQIVMIVDELRRRGHKPTIIYNTNSYDLPETLRTLEGLVDVWLPDFKYSDDKLAEELSQAPGYIKYALAALKEMVHQVGTTLHTDENGIARRGIIIRHLVLPGFVENSTGILKIIAKELYPSIHLSLMSQYYPPHKLIRNSSPEEGIRRRQEPGGVLSTSSLNTAPEHSGVRPGQAWKSLKRTVTSSEYESVLEAFHCLGFTGGWLQDFQSNLSYRPDFSRKTPFDIE